MYMTTDERIDKLLSELDSVSQEYYHKLYTEPAIHCTYNWDETKAAHKILIKKFMQDMEENIVHSQAVDEFVEYAEKRGTENGSSLWFMSMYAEDFKQEKGYL